MVILQVVTMNLSAQNLDFHFHRHRSLPSAKKDRADEPVKNAFPVSCLGCGCTHGGLGLDADPLLLMIDDIPCPLEP